MGQGKIALTERRRLRRFLRRLRFLRLERAILFGSRAKGEALSASDYDLILVSRDFEGIPLLARMDKVLAQWDAPVGLDVMCFTPEEFRKKIREYGLVRDAACTGVPLA